MANGDKVGHNFAVKIAVHKFFSDSRSSRSKEIYEEKEDDLLDDGVNEELTQ